ncbi:MAG TPA: radical SAM protein [Syntrophobacteraceae bacterium]|nr:radical SAM protein [Syntrophobacteraceae bacterium]
MNRNRIYPVFLPHLGCTFRCVYCNQNVTSGTAPFSRDPSRVLPRILEDIEELSRSAVACRKPGQIAFYGGTFTALPTEILEEVLDAAAFHVRRGTFTGIRFSTRPDAVTRTVCSLLKSFPVQTVELGVQSLSDEVLRESRRGYGADAVLDALQRVRSSRWDVGFQLMPGLPGDSPDRFLGTVTDTLAMKPDFVRLYPVLVLPGTTLAGWYEAGRYRPLSFEEAIRWCARAYDRFHGAGIRVVRMGLHAGPELTNPGSVLAGPFHPSFGYLVRVRWWRNRIDEAIRTRPAFGKGARLILWVGERFVSEVLGPDRSNVSYWLECRGLENVQVQGDKNLHRGEYRIVLESESMPRPQGERSFS